MTEERSLSSRDKNISREHQRAIKEMYAKRSFLNEESGAVSRSIIMHEMLLDRIKSMTKKLKGNLHKYPDRESKVLKMN